MRPQRIDIHIEELVLHGLATSQRPQHLSAAIERELATRLAGNSRRSRATFNGGNAVEPASNIADALARELRTRGIEAS